MRHVAGKSRAVNGADATEILQDDEIRGEGGESGEIDEVKAPALCAFGRDDGIDFGGREAVGQVREDDMGKGSRLRREVALEGDSGDIRPCVDSEEDFRGRGEEGADAHGLCQAYLRG